MAASIEITPELMAGFLDEAADHFEALNRCLLAFEKDAEAGAIDLRRASDAERMNETFRAAHSLKGLSGVFGFDDINKLTHRMETLFDEARMGNRSFDTKALGVLLECVGVLEALVADLQNPGETQPDIDGAMKNLDELLSAHQTPASAAENAGISAELAANVANLPTSILQEPELRKGFLESTEEAIEGLSQGLLALEKGASEDLLNDIFRHAHNLKGACGAAALHDATKLTHSMETVFDELRSHARSINDATMGALFRASDSLREIIQGVKDECYEPMTDAAVDAVFEAVQQTGDGATQAEERAATVRVDATPTESELVAAAVTPTDAPSGSAPAAVSDAVPLGAPHDVLDAAGRGYEVLIQFAVDDPERELQAFVILNKLKSIGDVTWAEPNLETGSLGNSDHVRFVVRLSEATAGDGEALRKLLTTFKVIGVEVTCFGASAERAEESQHDAAHDAVAATVATAQSAEIPNEPAPAMNAAPASNTPAVRQGHPAVMAATVAAARTNKPAITQQPAAQAPATQIQGGAARPASKTSTETIRVDVERLDQLMNLGGELVINRARFSEVSRQFKGVFEGKDFCYIAEDLASQFSAVRQDLKSIGAASPEIAAVSARIANIAHDFETLQQLINRVHDARPAMHNFDEAVNTLDRISEGLQKRIMETRMVPVGPLFQRFQRLTRDLAKDLNKKIELVMNGEQTELDKKMIDELADPLTHVVRNSADHGIELPEDRIKAGKKPVATITLSAYHQGNCICIDVDDDGCGVNLTRVREKIIERGLATEAAVGQMSEHELTQYVFHPGFSTAKKVSDLSGRGMGMDIVKTKIGNLNGTVELDSVAGKGTTVRFKLPLTLAIIRSLQTKLGGDVYAIPLESVAEIVGFAKSEIRAIQGQRVALVRDHVVPVCLLEEMIDDPCQRARTHSVESAEWTIVILEAQSSRVGLVVDELIGQEDIVIKSLAENYRNVPGFSGATIMGDGRVALILDIGHLIAKRGAPTSGAGFGEARPEFAASA